MSTIKIHFVFVTNDKPVWSDFNGSNHKLNPAPHAFEEGMYVGVCLEI